MSIQTAKGGQYCFKSRTPAVLNCFAQATYILKLRQRNGARLPDKQTENKVLVAPPSIPSEARQQTVNMRGGFRYSQGEESNLRPAVYETAALPLSYPGISS